MIWARRIASTRASIGPPTRRPSTGGASLTSSTPDALWSAPSLRRPAPGRGRSAPTCSRGRRLRRLLALGPGGTRLLLVSDPDASASTLLRVLAGLVATPSAARSSIAGSTRSRSTDGWGRRRRLPRPGPGIHTLDDAARGAPPGRRPARPAAPTRARGASERAIAWARIPPRPPDAADEPRRRRRCSSAPAWRPPSSAIPRSCCSTSRCGRSTRSERHRPAAAPGPRGRRSCSPAAIPASEVGPRGARRATCAAGGSSSSRRVGALEAAGLPLSHRGIAALAEMRAADAAGAPAARARRREPDAASSRGSPCASCGSPSGCSSLLAAYVGAGAARRARSRRRRSTALIRLAVGAGGGDRRRCRDRGWPLASERALGRAGWLVTRSITRGTDPGRLVHRAGAASRSLGIVAAAVAGMAGRVSASVAQLEPCAFAAVVVAWPRRHRR